jgi:hypothetical protein
MITSPEVALPACVILLTEGQGSLTRSSGRRWSRRLGDDELADQVHRRIGRSG